MAPWMSRVAQDLTPIIPRPGPRAKIMAVQEPKPPSRSYLVHQCSTSCYREVFVSTDSPRIKPGRTPRASGITSPFMVVTRQSRNTSVYVTHDELVYDAFKHIWQHGIDSTARLTNGSMHFVAREWVVCSASGLVGRLCFSTLSSASAHRTQVTCAPNPVSYRFRAKRSFLWRGWARSTNEKEGLMLDLGRPPGYSNGLKSTNSETTVRPRGMGRCAL